MERNRRSYSGIGGEMMEMAVGDTLEFPIRDLQTVRNRVSTFNTMHYLDGIRWRSVSDKESGMVYVIRIA